MSTLIVILAPLLTSLGFAAVLRAATLLEDRLVDEPPAAKST